MATAEERIDKLESKFPTLEQQVSTIAAKVDIFIEESRQQREDLRRAQEKHDADMREARENMRAAQEKHDADMKTAQEKHDADMKEIRGEIRDALRNIQGLTIASMVGIAAIAVGVLGFLWTTARNMEPPPAPPPITQAAPQSSSSQ